jgi:hypothetical protein
MSEEKFKEEIEEHFKQERPQRMENEENDDRRPRGRGFRPRGRFMRRG